MSDELAGKIAVITGAAGSVGATTARALAAAGAQLVLTDLDGERLDALVAELGEDHAVGRAGDAADSDHVRETVGLAVERFGGLDIAFANAGISGAIAPLSEYPEDAFDEVMRVNVRGPFLLCRHALAAMRDGGSIVITSSVVGLTFAPGSVAYSTSKHALVGLMRTAMKEASPRGIRVNTIHPGPIDNEFQHRIEMTATGLDEAGAAEAFEAMIPLARHATADEVAAAVMWLVGRGGGFVTGATIPIDGGMSV
jgi:NAD(P)-dependent dehydrogenase (short-subunit alcohol dehydrogenase family)